MADALSALCLGQATRYPSPRIDTRHSETLKSPTWKKSHA